MTTNESFKRRIRSRMTETGERYGAARRVLIEQAARRRAPASRPARARVWVSEPELSDDSVREATGRGWDEWCDLLDAWPGHDDGHTAIATHVRDDLGVDGWWAQTVTVGYERITGRRLPYQRSDGTFSANRSRTVSIDAAELRAALLDEDARSELFPGLATELRSRPSSKGVRIGIGTGIALFDLDALHDGRLRLSIAHERLDSPEECGWWQDYWSAWLDALS